MTAIPERELGEARPARSGGFDTQLAEAIRAAAGRETAEPGRPIRILFLGPSRAGKTFLLYALGHPNSIWAKVDDKLGEVKFADMSPEFRRVWDLLAGQIPAVGQVDKEAFEVALAAKWRLTPAELPQELQLFRANGIPVSTYDFSGEVLARVEHWEDSRDAAMELAAARIIAEADAFILVVDPFPRPPQEAKGLEADAIARKERNHHRFLLDLAPLLAACGKPLAVVATKFDEAQRGPFKELLDAHEDANDEAALAISRRPAWVDSMRSEVKDAIGQWDLRTRRNPQRGTTLVELVGVGENVEYFACSAFGPCPHKTGPMPIMVLEPVAFVVNRVEAVRQQTRTQRLANQKAKEDAIRQKTEADRRRWAAEREAAERQARERRAALMKVLRPGAFCALAGLAAAASFCLLLVGEWLAAGQIDAARRLAGWCTWPLAGTSFVPDTVTGHAFLLSVDATDRAETEEGQKEWLAAVATGGSETPHARQAALAVVLEPRDRLRNDEPDAAKWLALDEEIHRREQQADLAPLSDSYSRRQIRAARAEVLLAAWSKAGVESRDATAQRLAAILDAGAEPLPDTAVLPVLAALVEHELATAARWDDVHALCDRVTALVRCARRGLSEVDLGAPVRAAWQQIAALAPAKLPAVFDEFSVRTRSDAAGHAEHPAAVGQFWARFGAGLQREIHERLVPQWVREYQEASPAPVERFAALLAHPWTNAAVANPARSLFRVAVAKAVQAPGEPALLLLVLQSALSREFPSAADGASPRSLDEADERLLWGPRDAAARRAHFAAYEANLASASGIASYQAWVRYVLLAEVVDRAVPAGALLAQLLDDARARQRGAVVRIVKEAPDEVRRGQAVNAELVAWALREGKPLENQGLVAVIVASCEALPDPFFATIGATALKLDDADPWILLLRVLAAARGPAPGKDSPDLARQLDELVRCLLRRSKEAPRLTTSVERLLEERLKQLVGLGARVVDAAEASGFAKSLAAIADADFRLSAGDEGPAAAVLERQAVRELEADHVSAAATALQQACKLDPAGAERRTAVIEPVHVRAETDAVLRERLLALAEKVEGFAADLATAVRRRSAPALERAAFALLDGTEGKIAEAAATLRRAVQYDADGADRRLTACGPLLARGETDAALRERLLALADAVQPFASGFAVAVRTRTAPALERSALARLAKGEVVAAAADWRRAVQFDAGATERRGALLPPELAKLKIGDALLTGFIALADTPATLEPAHAGLVRTHVAGLLEADAVDAITKGEGQRAADRFQQARSVDAGGGARRRDLLAPLLARIGDAAQEPPLLALLQVAETPGGVETETADAIRERVGDVLLDRLLAALRAGELPAARAACERLPEGERRRRLVAYLDRIDRSILVPGGDGGEPVFASVDLVSGDEYARWWSAQPPEVRRPLAAASSEAGKPVLGVPHAGAAAYAAAVGARLPTFAEWKRMLAVAKGWHDLYGAWFEWLADTAPHKVFMAPTNTTDRSTMLSWNPDDSAPGRVSLRLVFPLLTREMLR